MIQAVLFLISLFLSLPVCALTQQPLSETERTISDYIKDYVDIPAGALDWKILGKAREITVDKKTPEGYDMEYTKPGFTKEIRALDGKEITIKGFMFPLEESEKQKLFLFGPFPISCPFHYHVGPSLVLEVHTAKKPVKFSYDPIILKGRLVLVEDDPEYSTFYRLTDAEQVKAK